MKLLCLHGFTGRGRVWEPVLAALPGSVDAFCPDLVGHGATAPAVNRFEDEVDRLAGLIVQRAFNVAASAPRHLVGYSLGARLGLGLLLRYGGLFDSATLIGVQPGLNDAALRQRRAADDEALAAFAEDEGIEAFVARWEAHPLFASQQAVSASQRAAQRAMRLGHRPASLARALRILGLAQMPDYGPQLAAIAQPVRLLVGEHDVKFRRLAADMAQHLPRATVVTVPGAGHNLVLEAPGRVAAALAAVQTPSFIS